MTEKEIDDVARSVTGGPYGDGCAFIVSIAWVLFLILVGSVVLFSYCVATDKPDANTNANQERSVN